MSVAVSVVSGSSLVEQSGVVPLHAGSSEQQCNWWLGAQWCGSQLPVPWESRGVEGEDPAAAGCFYGVVGKHGRPRLG